MILRLLLSNLRRRGIAFDRFFLGFRLRDVVCPAARCISRLIQSHSHALPLASAFTSSHHAIAARLVNASSVPPSAAVRLTTPSAVAILGALMATISVVQCSARPSGCICVALRAVASDTIEHLSLFTVLSSSPPILPCACVPPDSPSFIIFRQRCVHVRSVGIQDISCQRYACSHSIRHRYSAPDLCCAVYPLA